MRLDQYLVTNEIIKSRERAKEHIKNGEIKVNGIVVCKPAHDISASDKVEFTGEKLKYVGRGGLKIEKALSCFGVKLEGRICLDIGASTGGFTDCMLQNGAKFVYAVDVGSDQLDERLKNNPKVRNMEKTNIINAVVSDFLPLPDFITADVSFVSLKHIIPKIAEFLRISNEGKAVLLIKPQFEAGKRNIGKNGIVKDRKVHVAVINDIIAFCSGNGLAVKGVEYSPVSGGDGNIEYLLYLQNGSSSITIDIKKLVDCAFAELS